MSGTLPGADVRGFYRALGIELPDWAQLLAGRYVSVVFDCDRAGREAAVRIAADLKAAAMRGSVIDLARERQDGYDQSYPPGAGDGLLVIRRRPRVCAWRCA